VQSQPRHSDRIWSLFIKVNANQIPYYQCAFEGLNASLAWSHDATGSEKQLEVLLAPDERHVSAQSVRETVQSLLKSFDLSFDEVSLKELPTKNWLAENRKQFPPITCGQFFIYPSFYEERLPKDHLTIQLNAAMAFGSGEHETTKGCLHGLLRLAEKHSFKNILDLGCGSGILAIAAAKLWPASSVLAADFDHFAVKTTQDNVQTNQTPRVQTLFSDGFQSIETKDFDLIIANILAGPLIALAPEIYGHCAEGGKVILSGLLNWQERDVVSAYEKVGFELLENFVVKEWATLVFSKIAK
jgi:ribosomal protein L11 methyltransferase